MNKDALVKALANDTRMSKKDSEKFLISFEKIITNELANGGKVKLIGFGTYEIAKRPERQGRNPQTGEPMTINAKTVPRFKPGKHFTDAIDTATNR